MLNDKQKAFIVNNLWDYNGDLTIVCCKCAKAEFKIGGNLYVRLRKTETNRKKDPLYNNLKHKNKRPKPSRQLLQRLPWIKQELKKWIEENAHPDPRDTDAMVKIYNLGVIDEGAGKGYSYVLAAYICGHYMGEKRRITVDKLLQKKKTAFTILLIFFYPFKY